MSTEPTANPILAAVGAYRDEDLDTVPDGGLDHSLGEIDQALVRLEAERLRRLRAWDTRRVWARDGSKSAAAALARKSAIAPGTARDQLRVARRLAEAPVLAGAFADGDLTYPKVRVLAALADPDDTDRLRAAFAAAEGELVASAKRLSVRDTAYVAEHFAAHADPDRHERRWNDRYQNTRLNFSESFDGWGHLDGFFDPEATQILRHAIEQMSDRHYRRDHTQAKKHNNRDGHTIKNGEGETADTELTSAQRRAHSLVAMAHASLDTDPARDHDTGGVARPTIAVITEAALLHPHHPDNPDSDSPGNEQRSPVAFLAANNLPLPRSTAERYLCDAALVPITTDSHGVPLALGRATRDPSVGQLRALVIRDGGCAFPGCATPPRYTQAHHIHYWANRGPTDLDNLVLLCRHHHRLLHEQHWQCHHDHTTGRAVFTTPDGHPHHANPPPVHHARHARDLAHQTATRPEAARPNAA
jgi:hypothetical protein